MELFNSLTRQLETLSPLKGDEVRIYSCGPTVYERAHIGNLSSFIYADTLRRVIEASGYQTTHVMNITDVDDKTIAKSRQEYPDIGPMEALQKLTSKYEKLFMDDLKAVGVDVAKIKFVRATENIEAMQDLIRKLLDKDIAYIADDGIYFSIKNYEAGGGEYGRLVNVSSDSTSESRIDNDEYDKESAHDFALWKTAKPGDPAWDFDLNGQNIKGRPGWHIECSAMSEKYLGQPFDIHTGGVDLKFPHHENEIAQSTAAGDKELAKIFMHSEHMLVDGQKMSKSLNNFLTLEDITREGFDPLAFRLLVLEGKYNNQRDFNEDLLGAAKARLNGLRTIAAMLWQTREETGEPPDFETATKDILAASLDDLNLPVALAKLSETQKLMETSLLSKDSRPAFIAFVDSIDRLLGLDLSDISDLSAAQKQMIKERAEARENSDWQKADDLRRELEQQGVGLNDSPGGAVWYPL